MLIARLAKFRCLGQRAQEEQQILFKVPNGVGMSGVPDVVTQ
jgi:hypothetical protein